MPGPLDELIWLIIHWLSTSILVGQIVAPIVNPLETSNALCEGTLIYEPKFTDYRRDRYVPEKFDLISSSINPGPSGLGSPETTLINFAL